MLLLYFVVAGLVVGRLSGGRFAPVAEVHFRWWAVALGGLAFQGFLFSQPLAGSVGDAGPALYVTSTLAVLAALLRNLSLPGFRVIALGAALNLVAILTNGGLMPAGPAAVAALLGVPELPAGVFTNSELIGPATVFPYLGDVFVLPRPLPFANVFSVGDVVIGLGAVLFLVRTMHQAPTSAVGGSVRTLAARPT